MNRRPSPNLVGTDGSRLPSRIQSQAKIGASTMTKKGCTTCNQEEGNSKPNRCRSVLRSAKSASDDPAASYPAQNRMANKNSTKMAPIRPHSGPVNPRTPAACTGVAVTCATGATARARASAAILSRAGCR